MLLSALVLVAAVACSARGGTGSGATPSSPSISVSFDINKCKSATPGPIELPSSGPALTDDTGCAVENPELVKKVYHELEIGDYDALMKYGGDRGLWNEERQPELLSQPDVRAKVMKSMTVHPHCDGGCVYPGFTTTGWDTELARSDAKALGVDPAAIPDPTVQIPVYTSFFPDCACDWLGVGPPKI
ncbi:hypothetical protein [Amycolatopsis iheyensis]|uniref:hypothetical protein n=1 Tax=Amycolatopsis iheyensis TaxID=2945988 RepID=UPI002152FCFA|nr:hypothetical protein [Amycolatopsis iheyensis]